MSATISVVVAAFNSRRTIGPCLDSVVAQNYPDVELIIVDGASTDGTAELLESRRGDFGFWLSEPDRGVYDAWNKALDHVTGDWVTFLGSDDQYAAPDVLSRMAPHLASARIHRVVYGQVQLIGGDGSVIRTLGEPWPAVRAEFREHMTLPHPATFQHRSLFEEHGRFDDGFRVAGDYEFLLRELLDHDALFVPDVTVVRMGSSGLSNRPDLAALVLRESHRARYMHGLVSQSEWRSAPLYRSMVHAKLRQRFGAHVADKVGDAYRFITRSGSR